MRIGEKGFALIELVIVIAITSMVAVAAGSAIFQTYQGTERNNDQITAVRQLQNAGYWISRDGQMAASVNTTVTLPNFLIVSWNEWTVVTAGSDVKFVPTSHNATYFFRNLSQGVGKLERYHWSEAGASEYTSVAQYIYYNPGDTDNTSKALYERPVLTVKLAAHFGATQETREYKIRQRPG